MDCAGPAVSAFRTAHDELIIQGIFRQLIRYSQMTSVLNPFYSLEDNSYPDINSDWALTQFRITRRRGI